MMKHALSFGLAFLLSTSTAFAAKSYQVTGIVTDLTPTKITVQKPNKEVWELDADPVASKGLAGVKKGDKVTISYTMMVKSVESKAAATKKK
jgi:hypothetical protein